MAAPLVHVDESKTAGEPAEVETVDDADVHPSKGMCDSIPVLGPCCGVWNKFGLTGQTLIAVVLGFLLGLLMRDIKPSKDWIQLVGYPGEIFVRSLKLLVVPMIATCMVIDSHTHSAVFLPGNLGELSKIKFIGTRALAYYLSTTGIGCLVGIAFANIFEPGKATGDQVIAAKAAALLIANNMTSMVVLDTTTKYDDLAGNKETIDVFLDIGRSLVPDNITAALADTNILGIITFFLCVGFAINHQNTDESRRVLSFFSTLNDSFMYLVTGVIVMTPLGVASLVASEVSKQVFAHAQLHRCSSLRISRPCVCSSLPSFVCFVFRRICGRSSESWGC
jgi:Na+/H+-dicarboxylate symporter